MRPRPETARFSGRHSHSCASPLSLEACRLGGPEVVADARKPRRAPSAPPVEHGARYSSWFCGTFEVLINGSAAGDSAGLLIVTWSGLSRLGCCQ